ncbi:plasmid mobilization protein [Helicobacter bizzozeronii]|uniref:plasmid mobilization protein n=1 Tax=Helicobacter bizzozeronii TaxID=56877 RepID=UPI000CEE8A29|nr:plasmid mobilization relaxosome protein MobC [Helicobacter bizzozeronii]
MSRENKTITLRVRFTPSELEQVKNKAQESGLDISKYVRSCTLNQKIGHHTDLIAIASRVALRNTLSSLGNNLNQIAKKLNRNLPLDAQALDTLKSIQAQIGQIGSAYVGEIL